jgi:hypothetical protein
MIILDFSSFSEATASPPMPSRAAVSRSSVPTVATRCTASAPCCSPAPNGQRRRGSGDVVARIDLGGCRRLWSRHHAAGARSPVYRHRRLLLDQCLRPTTSQNVQSPAPSIGALVSVLLQPRHSLPESLKGFGIFPKMLWSELKRVGGGGGIGQILGNRVAVVIVGPEQPRELPPKPRH